MIGGLITRVVSLVGDHFGAAICGGMLLSVLGLFVALALLRGGK
jgi:hypothetical protein